MRRRFRARRGVTRRVGYRGRRRGSVRRRGLRIGYRM